MLSLSAREITKIVPLKSEQLTRSSSSISKNGSDMISHTDKEKDEFSTTAKMIDELISDLARAHTYVVKNEFGHTLIAAKYYEKAAYLMYRIPVYMPKPPFEIELADLTPKLKKELSELKFLDPRLFWYEAKMAVARIFENIHFDYFHHSVMQHLRIKFVLVNKNAEKQKAELSS